MLGYRLYKKSAKITPGVREEVEYVSDSPASKGLVVYDSLSSFIDLYQQDIIRFDFKIVEIKTFGKIWHFKNSSKYSTKMLEYVREVPWTEVKELITPDKLDGELMDSENIHITISDSKNKNLLSLLVPAGARGKNSIEMLQEIAKAYAHLVKYNSENLPYSERLEEAIYVTDLLGDFVKPESLIPEDTKYHIHLALDENGSLGVSMFDVYKIHHPEEIYTDDKQLKSLKSLLYECTHPYSVYSDISDILLDELKPFDLGVAFYRLFLASPDDTADLVEVYGPVAEVKPLVEDNVIRKYYLSTIEIGFMSNPDEVRIFEVL